LTACAEETPRIVEIKPPDIVNVKPVTEIKPDTVPPYQVPTFTGENIEWHKLKPAINPRLSHKKLT
jgi:hypothetical protein